MKEIYDCLIVIIQILILISKVILVTIVAIVMAIVGLWIRTLWENPVNFTGYYK